MAAMDVMLLGEMNVRLVGPMPDGSPVHELRYQTSLSSCQSQTLPLGSYATANPEVVQVGLQ